MHFRYAQKTQNQFWEWFYFVLGIKFVGISIELIKSGNKKPFPKTATISMECVAGSGALSVKRNYRERARESERNETRMIVNHLI